MNRLKRGFTLIELIVVMVVLASLAATALPKFFSLSSEARIASLDGAAWRTRTGAVEWYRQPFALPAAAAPQHPPIDSAPLGPLPGGSYPTMEHRTLADVGWIEVERFCEGAGQSSVA